MQKYPYLLYLTLDNYLAEEFYLLSSDRLHILAPNINSYRSLVNAKEVFLYSFNQVQVIEAKKHDWKSHISLLGEELFNPELLSLWHEGLELFWFPTQEQIQEGSGRFSLRLQEINKPICISYHPYIQTGVIPEEFRGFVQSIYKKFSNPLYTRELELLGEYEDSPLENSIAIQINGNVELFPAVLGIFGDLPIYDVKNFYKNNIKTIIKNPECISCSMNELCIKRGIGYIMHQLNYQGCIGIELMQVS